MYEDIQGVYRYREHTDVWGVKMSRAYRHVWELLGEYRCTGGMQLYRDRTHMGDVWGHTNIQAVVQTYGWMYGGIYTYMGIQIYGGCTDVWKCTNVGVILTPPDIQPDRHTQTCLPSTPGYYYFL